MVCTDIAYASDEKPNNDILSIKKEQDQFNENIADVSHDIDICIEAYKKKNQGSTTYSTDDLVEGVHPAENIRIYAFTTKNPQVFYEEYDKSDELEEFISPTYSIVALYRDDNDTFIDSVFYMKPENANQDDDTWERLCSGGMIFSDETLEFLSDTDRVNSLLTSLNIVQPKNLKVVTGIEGVEGVLFLETNDNQFVIPLSSGYTYGEDVNTCEKFTPYVAKEFFEARKISVLENVRKLEEWNALAIEEKTYGSKRAINYVELHPANIELTIQSDDSIKENSITVNKNNIIVPIIILFFVIGGVLAVISRKIFRIERIKCL